MVLWMLQLRRKEKLLSGRLERIGDFYNLNPVQYFYCVIQSDPDSVLLSKYLIQYGLYKKKQTLIKYLTAVLKAVWISIISFPEDIFRNTVRSRPGVKRNF